jgi:hypothetical protein
MCTRDGICTSRRDHDDAPVLSSGGVCPIGLLNLVLLRVCVGNQGNIEGVRVELAHVTYGPTSVNDGIDHVTSAVFGIRGHTQKDICEE